MDADPSTPALWALRDTLQLTGTKFGCCAALCDANAMAGNICRCGTCARVRAAIKDAAASLA